MRIKNFTLLLVILFGLASILVSCGNSSASIPDATKKADASTNEPSEAEKAEVAATDETEAVTLHSVAADTASAPDETDVPASSDTEDTSSNANKSSSRLAERTADEARLGVVIDLIAQDLEAQKLEYISAKGQDCSGIYHKIKDKLQKNYEVLGDRSKFHYPSFTEDRNSRQIAQWYYDHDNFHIVQDANKDCNLITPGTVVFFGRTDEVYNNITIDLLTNPGKFVHDGTNGKIMHVAVVTTVEKDDAGNVIKYDMMHGRNSRNFASRTTANYDGPGSYAAKHAKFPFGNWNQQLVALAHIETPK